MPQDLVQAEGGPNPPHCPSTGVKSVELGMQLPRTQIWNMHTVCVDIKILNILTKYKYT